MVDGGSTDGTLRLVQGHVESAPSTRIQAAALNLALDQASGEVFVVDGHCEIAHDYASCVAAIERTGASMVGGALPWPGRDGSIGGSPLRWPAGWGRGRPVPCRRAGRRGGHGVPGGVPHGARVAVGGYAEDQAVNEDAELAIGGRSGRPLRPSLHPRRPRPPVLAVRPGRDGAQDPRSLSPRQLAAPLLVVGLLSPWRRPVLADCWAWGRRARPGRIPGGCRARRARPCWGAGFLAGLVPVGRPVVRRGRRDGGVRDLTRAAYFRLFAADAALARLVRPGEDGRGHRLLRRPRQRGARHP